MKKIILTSVSAFVLMGSMANAEDGQWYAGVEGYFSILDYERSKGSVLNIGNDFKDGAGFAGIFGYDYGHWRLEGDIGKHYHKADYFDVVNAAGLGFGTSDAASGKSNLTHYMLNAVYDFNESRNDTKIEPFVGGGVGLANINWSDFRSVNDTQAFLNDSDTVFAYQAFAGLRVPVSEAVDIALKYRYMGTSTNDSTLTDRVGNYFSASYDVHDFVVGVTYRFGGSGNNRLEKMPQPISRPAPQPEPEPAPAPIVKAPDPVPAPPPVPKPIQIDKGPFMVYFGWDSSEITTEALGIIAKAAKESKKSDEIVINLSGYTDRSGPNKYNDALSLKRAEAVKNELIKEGVSSSTISIEAHGEQDTAINTEDGVREDRNRRVTIILR